MIGQKPFGEILESSLTGWTAQSWEWDIFPAFGSLVYIQTEEQLLFGLVYDIKTGSMDPNRYPFAYKKSHEELKREQPQIFEFLQTTFSCINIGYYRNKTLIHQLAPEPPKIHTFVAYPDTELHKIFFSTQGYLHILFGLKDFLNNVDELLLALLKHINEQRLLNKSTFEEFIDTFSLLTGNDYRRLKIFLQRAQNFYIV